jgi:hypothetical protein
MILIFVNGAWDTVVATMVRVSGTCMAGGFPHMVVMLGHLAVDFSFSLWAQKHVCVSVYRVWCCCPIY